MTNSDYIERLENWATMAAQELQDILDDAQEAAGNPDGVDQMPATRMLLRELDEIMPTGWQDDLADGAESGELKGLDP